MQPVTNAQGPATGTNGPAPGTVRKSRNVRYPLQLKLNIDLAMDAALKRYCHATGLEPGVAARLILRQAFLNSDQQFRQHVEAGFNG